MRLKKVAYCPISIDFTNNFINFTAYLTTFAHLNELFDITLEYKV